MQEANDFKKTEIIIILKQEEKNRKLLLKKVLMDLEDKSGIYGEYQFVERTRFSGSQYRKIMSGRESKPTIGFVISLCFAYELSYSESLQLLARCGFALNSKEVYQHYVYDFLLRILTGHNEFYDKIDYANDVLQSLRFGKLNPKEDIY